MPDSELIAYIRNNLDDYGTEKLKKGLLKQGIAISEIEEALAFIEEADEKNKKIVIQPDDLSSPSAHLRGSGNYRQKADDVLYALLKLLKVSPGERELYLAAVKYGALSFAIVTILTFVFQYFGGQIVYPKVAINFGALGALALPDVFILYVGLGSLVASVLWSFIWGAVISYLFLRYLLNVWPFKIWHSLFKKTFFLYFAVKFFFAIIIDGFVVSFSSQYFLGYLVVALGILLSSYAGAYYFSDNVYRTSEEKIKELIRKSW
ncbi:hypothetical protein HYV44_01735 [Candidatus Microgenomates bacterium]|nr:hypothetical protein [Candidatus Microgenomates bacterium]